MVLGEASGGLSRPRTRSLSVPDDPEKRFEKFKKKRKIMNFHDFARFSLAGRSFSAGAGRTRLAGRSPSGREAAFVELP